MESEKDFLCSDEFQKDPETSGSPDFIIADDEINEKDAEVKKMILDYFKILKKEDADRETKNTHFAKIAGYLKLYYYEKAKAPAKRVMKNNISNAEWDDIEQQVTINMWRDGLKRWIEKSDKLKLSLLRFLGNQFRREAHILIAKRNQIDPNVLYRYWQLKGLEEKYNVPMRPENYHIISILSGVNIAVIMSILRRWHEIVPIDDDKTEIEDDGNGGKLVYSDNHLLKQPV